MSESGFSGFQDFQDCDFLIFCWYQNLKIEEYLTQRRKDAKMQRKIRSLKITSRKSYNPGYPDS
ncbi:MAG: hypothetical protein ACKPB7_08385, partial [Sphaerospermopsis kisseleviana]